MTEQHHPHGPSTLPRLHNCPGYPRMRDICGIDEESGPPAEEGRMLHRLMAMPELNMTKYTIEGEQAWCIGFCEEFLTRHGGRGEWQFEVTMSLQNDAGRELLYGTLDGVRIMPDGDGAETVEWKFGRVPVANAADNEQVKAYAAMALDGIHNLKYVDAFVVAPRMDCRESHARFTADDLDLLTAEIETDIARAEAPGLSLNAGKWCVGCSARLSCPALRETQAVVVSEDAKLTVTAENVVDLHHKRRAVQSRLDALKAQITAFVTAAGQVIGVDGHGLVMKSRRGNRKVADVRAAFAGSGLDATEFLDLCSVDTKLAVSLIAGRLKGCGAADTMKEAAVQAEEMLGVVRAGDSLVLTEV